MKNPSVKIRLGFWLLGFAPFFRRLQILDKIALAPAAGKDLVGLRVWVSI